MFLITVASVIKFRILMSYLRMYLKEVFFLKLINFLLLFWCDNIKNVFFKKNIILIYF
jgi:hypothetical protein